MALSTDTASKLTTASASALTGSWRIVMLLRTTSSWGRGTRFSGGKTLTSLLDEAGVDAAVETADLVGFLEMILETVSVLGLVCLTNRQDGTGTLGRGTAWTLGFAGTTGRTERSKGRAGRTAGGAGMTEGRGGGVKRVGLGVGTESNLLFSTALFAARAA